VYGNACQLRSQIPCGAACGEGKLGLGLDKSSQL
jgi:hypothetical protein